MGLYLLLQLFWLAITLEVLASQPLATTKPGCPDKCGIVSIPYPFGIGDNCTIGVEGFNISCNNTFHPPKPFWGELEVLEISLVPGLMRISNDISYKCYDKITGDPVNYSTSELQLYLDYSFTFSETLNKFISIGCDTVGLITGQWGSDFTSGCVSICRLPDNVTDGSCSGAGCCQTEIPKGLKKFSVNFTSFSSHLNVSTFNPCSFAFLGEEHAFRFKPSDLEETNFLERSKTTPVVVDWVIGNEPCKIAQDSATFGCVSENSYCYNPTNGSGYRCNCTEGFRGNPYLHGGCRDINECEEDHQKTLCQHDCINLPGNYSCSCRKGYRFQEDNKYCVKDANEFPVTNVVLAQVLRRARKMDGRFGYNKYIMMGPTELAYVSTPANPLPNPG